MADDRLRGRTLVRTLTAPQRVVVVGGGTDRSKISGRSLSYLTAFGFSGEVVLVTSRDVSENGVKVVASVDLVEPSPGTAAIVNLPAAAVVDALAALERRHVDTAVVIGSGFEEHGSRHRTDLEQLLARPDFRMRVVGPNCVGTMSAASGAHLNFSSVLQTHEPRAGGIALITQSGALGNGLFMSLLRSGVGVGHWLSTGNELDVGAFELASGLLAEDDVSCLGIFLEGVTDPEWLDAIGRVIRDTGKPIFFLKAARTSAGAVAAGGHTGRVVGASGITSAALRELGLTEVADIAALTDALVVADTCRPRGRSPLRVGVVSVSGASGVIAADRISESAHLELADHTAYRDDLAARLDQRLTIANPLDVPFVGETRPFAEAIHALRTMPHVDAVLAVESSLAHDRDELVEAVDAVRASAATTPVVLTHLSELDGLATRAVTSLAAHGVAVLATVERSVSALDAVASTLPSRSGPSPSEGEVHRDEHQPLGLEHGARLLPGFDWSPWSVAHTAVDARALAEKFGFPCVVKALGRTIAHRTDVGAVAVVKDEADLDEAFARVQRVCRGLGDEVVVQAFAPPGGVELMIAALAHPEVGPTAVVQIGGTLAELVSDQVLLPQRSTRERHRELLQASRAGQLLAGYRGAPAADVEKVLDLVRATIDAVERDGLSFVELNPVLAYPGGLTLIDVVARLNAS